MSKHKHVFHVFVVRDTHGNECLATCADVGDVVLIHGLRDATGALLHFETDPRKLERWTAKNGLDYIEVTKKAEVDWQMLTVDITW